MIDDRPVAPSALPDGVADQPRGLDDDGLGGLIDCVHDRLDEHQHHRLAERIDEVDDDELVSLTEHEGHLEVVHGHRCAGGCPDCPHGPYPYHVRTVPRQDGGSNIRWEFIGPLRRE